MALTYRDAGVDIDAGDALVDRIKPFAARTRIPEVLEGIGGFAGLCALPTGMKEPILVSGTDGVGTKLKLAFMADVHDTVGIDLVAMCVNDVVTVGARPLFFLDYFATGKLDVARAADVIKGIAAGCEQAGCALLGGETAELPGFYADGEYDLAGFSVGVVDKAKLVDGKRVAAGDVVLGVASSGLHSNGYSLVRKALLDVGKMKLDAHVDALGETLAAALLRPTRIYARAVKAALAAGDVRALSHITGGGLPGNVPRVLPEGLGVSLRKGSWPRPAVFDLVQKAGGVPEEEMLRTFNVGLGLVAVVAKADADAVRDALVASGEQAWVIGEVIETPGAEYEQRVRLSWSQTLDLVVLASGRGSNLAAIFAAIDARTCDARVAAVVSDKPDAPALGLARERGVETRVVPLAKGGDRAAWDASLAETVASFSPGLVVLAGFMRIVGPAMLERFPSRVVNVHPALLPAFRGSHAVRDAIAAGARVTGCTVHLVDAGVDTGPILAQAAVPVLAHDDETKLHERIQVAEHRLLPAVIHWVARGALQLSPTPRWVAQAVSDAEPLYSPPLPR